MNRYGSDIFSHTSNINGLNIQIMSSGDRYSCTINGSVNCGEKPSKSFYC